MQYFLQTPPNVNSCKIVVLNIDYLAIHRLRSCFREGEPNPFTAKHSIHLHTLQYMHLIQIMYPVPNRCINDPSQDMTPTIQSENLPNLKWHISTQSLKYSFSSTKMHTSGNVLSPSHLNSLLLSGYITACKV